MNYNYGYARVSTDEQSLATQLDALDKHGCDKIFQEKITGTARDRPQLDALLAILRPGDTVTVARFSRLGRNSAHLIALIDQFDKDGIRFRALDLGIDTTTPAGRLVMTVFAGLAQYQREELLEKTEHGRALARANGTHMGRAKGADAVKYGKVKSAIAAGLNNAKIVELTGISESSVKRYRKLVEAEREAARRLNNQQL